MQSAVDRKARIVSMIPLACIQSCPTRPRRAISQESIDHLAESIRLHGLLSPLLVRKTEDGGFQLIAGERRLRALRALKRPWAEAMILTGSDCDCALIALVENLQREDLHFLDAAAACKRILDTQPITQERLAASLSCSPSALANRLRLLKLHAPVQALIRSNGLSERHARALLGVQDEAGQLALASLAAEQSLTVRQLEACVNRRAAPPAQKRKKMSPLVRDNRIVINALMDTVRQLSKIGVPVESRVEEGADYIDVIVRISTKAGRDRLN